MLWRRRWTSITGDIVKDCPHPLQYTIALGEHATLLKRNPCSLVFAISTLDLFVYTFLDFPLKDACSCGFVVVGYLQDVGSIDPVVSATSHDMVAVHIALVDRNLAVVSARSQMRGAMSGDGTSEQSCSG